MKFISYRANLFVNDLERSTKFYTDTIGLDLQMHDPNFGLTHLGKDGVQLALVQSSHVTPHSGFAEGYLEVTNLDVVFHRCNEHGVVITQQPTRHPWNMRDFVVLDPDGYAIAIGERMLHNPN